MKYYIIAGERSGDLHGANIIRALRAKDPEADIRCWGGDTMQQAGGRLVKHYRDLAFMGFWEVAINLRTIFGLLKFCQKDLVQYQPDVLILVDYPGFNMRMARFAKENGFKVFYYISPKIWAWNTGRAKKIKAYVDHMFVILPFEQDFYHKYDYKVDYVGNPLLDAIRNFSSDPDFKQKYAADQRPVIAVLPGSRRQEVQGILSVMLSITAAFPNCRFLVAAVDNLPDELYALAQQTANVEVAVGKTYDILHIAHAAIVTSGTATLETALFEVPQVVCYKTSPLSYQISKRLIQVPYISLVNLIVQEEVVPELIQSELNQERLKKELSAIVQDSLQRKAQLDGYRKLKALLGQHRPSEKAADLMMKYLKNE